MGVAQKQASPSFKFLPSQIIIDDVIEKLLRDFDVTSRLPKQRSSRYAGAPKAVGVHCGPNRSKRQRRLWPDSDEKLLRGLGCHVFLKSRPLRIAQIQ